MKEILGTLILVLAASLLSGCGSGGGGTGGTFTTDPTPSVELSATRVSLPVNSALVEPFIGSPYMLEVTARIKDGNGNPMTDDNAVSLAISPVEVAAISTLDNPETEDVNEFTQLMGSVSTGVSAGVSTFFVHAMNRTGTATVSVSVRDPVYGTIASATMTVEVVESANSGLPAQISVTAPQVPQYVQGSGGTDSKRLEFRLTDGSDQPIDDPEGYNNLQVEIVDNASTGARVSGTNASGQSQSGTSIAVATTNGIASVVLLSGSEPGVITLKVSADHADNNVDNGIQDPISDLLDFVISDGRLFSLQIVSPNLQAVSANVVDPDTNTNPDGTYSLTISAQGQDKLGNPVLPGTEISFSLVDYPAIGYPEGGAGQFVHSGSDGNPEEGGKTFVSLGGAFLDNSTGPDHAVEPGDAIMLFGHEIAGNAEHESVRIVQGVDSNSQVTATRDFNPNNGTGAMVDDGGVIPYLIGRALYANIGGSAYTDENGVATVTMNYPSNQLGRVVAISAQGNGAPTGLKSEVKTVADVETMVLPGIANLQFSVFADQIPGNTTVDVAMCLSDAQNMPVAGVFVGFIVNNSSGAVITVDGVANSGYVALATGADGCTVATVASASVAPGAGDVGITFFVGDLSDSITIVAPTDLVLFANPNQFVGNRTETVILTLVNGSGQGVENIQLLVQSCEVTGPGNVEVLVPPGVTDEDGETYTQLRSTGLNGYGEAGTAVCTFTGPNGEPQATVTFEGYDICALGASPAPPGCP